MSYIHVDQKYQMTIPPEVRSALNLRGGDLLEVEIREDGILLRPQATAVQTEEEKKARADRIMSYFGAGKGMFKSAEEIDAYIRRERDSWDD